MDKPIMKMIFFAGSTMFLSLALLNYEAAFMRHLPLNSTVYNATHGMFEVVNGSLWLVLAIYSIVMLCKKEVKSG